MIYSVITKTGERRITDTEAQAIIKRMNESKKEEV